MFAPGPRQVTVDQVAEIIPRLPHSIETIGVFVDSSFDEIEATVRTCGLTGVQLHFAAGHDLAARLRGRFGKKMHILRALHYGPDAEERALELAGDENIDAILVDSRTKSAVGGTGISYDWDAAESFFAAAEPG